MSEEEKNGQYRQAAAPASCDPVDAAGAGDERAGGPADPREVAISLDTRTGQGTSVVVVGVSEADFAAAFPQIALQKQWQTVVARIWSSAAPPWSRHAWGIPDHPVEDAGIRVGEIEAWRVWSLFKGRLRSVAVSCQWEPGEVVTGDVSIDGVHAFKDAAAAVRYGDEILSFGVLGKVALWGEVIEHEDGYRAEFARVIHLERLCAGLGYRRHHLPQEMIHNLRKEYGLSDKRSPRTAYHHRFPWPDEDHGMMRVILGDLLDDGAP